MIVELIMLVVVLFVLMVRFLDDPNWIAEFATETFQLRRCEHLGLADALDDKRET